MSNIKQLFREELREFSPYRSARMEASSGQIWLNANELPWESSVDNNEIKLNRYPQQQPNELRKILADYYNVNPTQLLLTRGSDEGIDLLVRLCCRAYRDAIMICPPTFGMYAISAKLQGAQVISVPLTQANFALDDAAILKIYQPSIKLIFLCSPNNPTGNVLAPAKIVKLCEALKNKAIIVVDEAYIEFANVPSLTNAISQYENLVVLRTLSKAFGLAGARVGGMIADPEIINALTTILPPYPLASLSTQAAISMLSSSSMQTIQQQNQMIINEREAMIEALSQLNIVIKLWPSSANFILVKFNKDVYAQCYQAGIVLRDMTDRIGEPNVVRISIGKPEDNAKLIALLRRL